MKCRHCLVEFHAKEIKTDFGRDVDQNWSVSRFDCPACGRMNLYLVNTDFAPDHSRAKTIKLIPIRPRGSTRPPCPKEVPDDIREDFEEACLVLPDSPKASAALSRRCLQNLLRKEAGVKQSNLYDEIQELLDSNSLPSYLAEEIDGVRIVGNIAIHPMRSMSTGQILPVEPGEAEGNLNMLEGLFDFFYVQPAKAKARIDALKAKHADIEKTPKKKPQ